MKCDLSAGEPPLAVAVARQQRAFIKTFFRNSLIEGPHALGQIVLTIKLELCQEAFTCRSTKKRVSCEGFLSKSFLSHSDHLSSVSKNYDFSVYAWKTPSELMPLDPGFRPEFLWWSSPQNLSYSQSSTLYHNSLFSLLYCFISF